MNAQRCTNHQDASSVMISHCYYSSWIVIDFQSNSIQLMALVFFLIMLMANAGKWFLKGNYSTENKNCKNHIYCKQFKMG